MSGFGTGLSGRAGWQQQGAKGLPTRVVEARRASRSRAGDRGQRRVQPDQFHSTWNTSVIPGLDMYKV